MKLLNGDFFINFTMTQTPNLPHPDVHKPARARYEIYVFWLKLNLMLTVIERWLVTNPVDMRAMRFALLSELVASRFADLYIRGFNSKRRLFLCASLNVLLRNANWCLDRPVKLHWATKRKNCISTKTHKNSDIKVCFISDQAKQMFTLKMHEIFLCRSWLVFPSSSILMTLLFNVSLQAVFMELSVAGWGAENRPHDGVFRSTLLSIKSRHLYKHRHVLRSELCHHHAQHVAAQSVR